MRIGKTFKKTKTMASALLKQGITPEKVALSIAMGMTLSLFPVPFVPVITCTVAAVVWRLNLALIQAANVLVMPVQWLLIVPFIRLGEAIYRQAPLPLSASDLAALLCRHPGEFLARFWRAALHASTAWLLISPVLLGFLYLSLLPLLRRVKVIQRRATH